MMTMSEHELAAAAAESGIAAEVLAGYAASGASMAEAVESERAIEETTRRADGQAETARRRAEWQEIAINYARDRAAEMRADLVKRMRRLGREMEEMATELEVDPSRVPPQSPATSRGGHRIDEIAGELRGMMDVLAAAR